MFETLEAQPFSPEFGPSRLHFNVMHTEPLAHVQEPQIINPFDLLDTLTPFEETDLGITFNELTELAANQPDNEEFSQNLRVMVMSAKESGQIEASIYMAAVLGAMACLHPHMQGAAGEALEAVLGAEQAEDAAIPHDDEHDHEHEHDSKKCEDCQNGRTCRRK